ncbi:MAG: hypothetical protein KA242_02980 [Chitinophagales bacterium]|jgi:hypothetical protein|nr:hypothetical protein [Chitinophagales bacterium]
MKSNFKPSGNRKNATSIILAASVLTLTLGSCAKCQTCEKNNADTVRVCEKDYSSNTAYGLKLDYYTALGYTCKNSP